MPVKLGSFSLGAVAGSAVGVVIGLTRRTVSQYKTGIRPVSRTVALAYKGWEATRKAA
jgi:uncharacterized membrane protein (GlpM family)